MAADYPKEVDYTSIPSGSRRRRPPGVIHECPKCGRNGLRLVFSWRKGRYQVSYHHKGVQTGPREAPIISEMCSVNSRTLRGLPLPERRRGRRG